MFCEATIIHHTIISVQYAQFLSFVKNPFPDTLQRGDIIGTNIFVLDFNELCDTHIAKMKKVEESQEEEE